MDVLWGDVNPSAKVRHLPPCTLLHLTVEVSLVTLHPRQGSIRLADRQHNQRISELPFSPLSSVNAMPLSTQEGMDVTYPRAIFSEGLAIDYKWFDRWDIVPRFEFGFGMRLVPG